MTAPAPGSLSWASLVSAAEPLFSWPDQSALDAMLASFEPPASASAAAPAPVG